MGNAVPVGKIIEIRGNRNGQLAGIAVGGIIGHLANFIGPGLQLKGGVVTLPVVHAADTDHLERIVQILRHRGIRLAGNVELHLIGDTPAHGIRIPGQGNGLTGLHLAGIY